MEWAPSILVFLLGLAIGSFLNVVIARFNTGCALLGRSKCMSCGHQLAFSDLIPVLSFLLLAGRCRYCGSRISLQYPLVELTTGFLFVLVFWMMPLSVGPLFLGWFISSLLVLITAYDIRHKIIPNRFVYPLIALSAGLLFVDLAEESFIVPSKWQLLAGPLLAAPLAGLFFLSGGRWMGFGDAKLELALGWLLGLWKGIAALLLAFWIGAALGIVLVVLHKISLRFWRYEWKSELAFGPFLVLGFFVAWFSGIDLYDLLSIFVV